MTSLIKGLITFIPGIRLLRKLEGGGAGSARYCYSVWLRHIVSAAQNGLFACPLKGTINSIVTSPEVVAELGPGDLIGSGIAALLSGSRAYYAFDVVEYAKLKKNLVIFEELLELFKRRIRIPDEDEFPKVFPRLHSYEFPESILSDEILDKTLDHRRIDAIKKAIVNPGTSQRDGIRILYFAPWYNTDIINEGAVDMIFSQAVMEHVEDLKISYEAMYRWLKPNGFISHEIDFKSHGTARLWNGHWTYSNRLWKLVKGQRPYFINREPCSKHSSLINQIGFKIIYQAPQKNYSGINRKELSPCFNYFSDDDLYTSSIYVLAKK